MKAKERTEASCYVSKQYLDLHDKNTFFVINVRRAKNRKRTEDKKSI